jgi:hypothetical protein
MSEFSVCRVVAVSTVSEGQRSPAFLHGSDFDALGDRASGLHVYANV